MPRVAPSNKKERIIGNGWLKHDNTLKGAWSFRTKEKIQCLCEGGNRCSKEAPEAQKGGNAIPGLHSNWVGQDASMLAMARPWHQYVLTYRLVDAFVNHNIGMVLNLQEVGEHDHCGPGNLRKSGFSYDPELFMAAKIGFFNFSWQDMGVPDLDRMMDIVQVMDYTVAVEKRKVAVHCHAGLGRTGLAIACYFLYQNRTTGACCSRQVIQTVRSGRPGALQTRTQELFVSIFQQYLLYLSCLFGGVEGPPKGLQSLHSSSNLAAMSTPQQASQSQQQQQAQPQSRHSSPGSSAFSMKGLLGRMSTSPKPAALQALQKQHEGGGSLEFARSGSLSLVTSSLAGSSSSLPSNLGSTKEGHGTTGNTSTKVFEHGLKIIGPSTPRGDKKSDGGTRSASPELTSAARQQERQEHKSHKHWMPPWDDKKCIQLSKYSTSWVPQPPHTYAEALRRQQRLLHGSHRRSYNHLHRFLKKVVFAIIAAAQEARANVPQGLAGAVHGTPPHSNERPQLQPYPCSTAYVPQPLIYHHITQSQQQHHVQNHHPMQQQQQQQQPHPQQQHQPQQAQPPPSPLPPLQAQSAPPTSMSCPASPLRPLSNPPSLPNGPPPPFALSRPTSNRSSASNFNLNPIEWIPELQSVRESPTQQLQQQLLAQEVLRISPTMRPRKLPPQRAKRPSTHASTSRSSPELLSEELPPLPELQPEDLFPGTPPSPHQHLGAHGTLPSPLQQHVQESQPRQKSSPGQLQLPSQISSPTPALQKASPSILVLPTPPSQPSQQAPLSPTPKQPPQRERPREANHLHEPHHPQTTAQQPPSPEVKASLPQPTQPTQPTRAPMPGAGPASARCPLPIPPPGQPPPPQPTQAPMPGVGPASARCPLPIPPPGQPPHTQPTQPTQAPMPNVGPASARGPLPTPPPGQAPPTALSKRRSSVANGPPYTPVSTVIPAARSSTLPPPLASPPPSALAKHDDALLLPHPPSSPTAATPRTSAWAANNSSNLSPSHTIRPPSTAPPPPAALSKRTTPNPTAPPVLDQAAGTSRSMLPGQAPHPPSQALLDSSVQVQQLEPPPQHHQQQQLQRSSRPVAEGVEDVAGHRQQQYPQRQPLQQQQQQQQQQGSPGYEAEGVEARTFAGQARHRQGISRGLEEACSPASRLIRHQHQQHAHASRPSHVAPQTNCSPLWNRLFQGAGTDHAQQASSLGYPSQHALPQSFRCHTHNLRREDSLRCSRGPVCEGLGQQNQGHAGLRHTQAPGISPSVNSRRGPVCEGLGQQTAGHPQGLGTYLRAPPHQQHQEHLQPCHSFTHAMALCIHQRRLEQQGVNVVASLARSPTYCYPFLGKEYTGAGVKGERPGGADSGREGSQRLSVSWDEGEGLHAHLELELLRLKRRANHEDFGLTSKAPLLLLVQALHDFFKQFHDAGPSLSLTTLEYARKHYKTLPYEADLTTPEAQQLQAATLVLSPIPVSDQELLLLFVALMRNCELAGGAGMSEEEEPELHTVTIGRWVLHLLVGPNISAELEEAMLSLLWYFLRNDVAYAAMVLAKKKRLDKLVHSGRPLVDHPAEDPVLAKYHCTRPPPPPPRSHASTQQGHQPELKGQQLSTLLESSRVHEGYRGHVGSRVLEGDEPELVSDQGIPWLPPIITDAPEQPASLTSGSSPTSLPLPEIHDAWK